VNNAQLHIQALIAQFGPLPILFETLGVLVESLSEIDGMLVIALYDEQRDVRFDWHYPNPEIWTPDPSGDIPRYVERSDDMGRAIIENGQPVLDELMGRIDPVAVATIEFTRQVGLWRT